MHSPVPPLSLSPLSSKKKKEKKKSKKKNQSVHACSASNSITGPFFLSFQCSDKLGLSLELGSFAAGVMIATTDLAQHTLEQV